MSPDKTHTFNWPKFDVVHSEILIDVYRNDLFEERILRDKDCSSIEIFNISTQESVHLQIFPSNGGSIYNKNYHITDKKHFSHKEKLIKPIQANQEIKAPSVVSSRVYISTNQHDKKSITAHCIIEGMCDKIQYIIHKGKKGGSPFYIDFTNKPHHFSFDCPKNKTGYLSFTPYYKDVSGNPYTHHSKI
tara:strand:- start:8559 stop:9125 length:567 start_codon:yes stop_codon:yes gene_type:complete